LSSTCPLVGAKRPLIRLNSVDLPAPFGADHGDALALLHLQAAAADDLGAAETLAHVLQFQRDGGAVAHKASLRLISFSMNS
jgi:hypothetical protein